MSSRTLSLYNSSLSVPRLKKSNSDHHSKNFSVNSLEYIWASSIPDSWKKIIEKNNIRNMKVNKNNRKTMDFLKETQQYIKYICRPLEKEESKIQPRKKKIVSISSRNSLLNSKAMSPPNNFFREGFLHKRRSNMIGEIDVPFQKQGNKKVLIPLVKYSNCSPNSVILQKT